MLPPASIAKVNQAKVVAEGLRQDANKLIAAAQAIDALVALVDQTTFTAQMNHDTILESRR